VGSIFGICSSGYGYMGVKLIPKNKNKIKKFSLRRVTVMNLSEGLEASPEYWNSVIKGLRLKITYSPSKKISKSSNTYILI
jgi:hypothetical protein